MARVRGTAAGNWEDVDTSGIWPCRRVVRIVKRPGVARIGRRCSWGRLELAQAGPRHLEEIERERESTKEVSLVAISH